MKLTILSGRSGSGKTTALQALEDHGYYCVDNLPLGLLPTLTEQLDTEEHAPERVAVGVDARNLPRQLLAFKSIIKALKNQQVETEVIFLDADPGTLLERFSATRRRHPLGAQQGSVEAAIQHERELLSNIRLRADLVIDTSNYDVHSLRNLMRERVANRSAALKGDYEMALGCTAPTATGVVQDDLENWLETLCGIEGEQSAPGVLPQGDDGKTGAEIEVDDEGRVVVTLAWYDARWQEQGDNGEQDADPIKTVSVSAEL